MVELDSNFLYEYLCDKLNSDGLPIDELSQIGNLNIGPQSVSGMIAMNQQLGYIIERQGKLFTAGESTVKLTVREQELLEEKARLTGQNPEDLLNEMVANILTRL